LTGRKGPRKGNGNHRNFAKQEEILEEKPVRIADHKPAEFLSAGVGLVSVGKGRRKLETTHQGKAARPVKSEDTFSWSTHRGRDAKKKGTLSKKSKGTSACKSGLNFWPGGGGSGRRSEMRGSGGFFPRKGVSKRRESEGERRGEIELTSGPKG